MDIVALTAPAFAEAASPPADELNSLGLMRIGEVMLALPVSALREVLPCPARLAPLPVVATGLRGAVQLRGSVIPVLDLRPTLGLPVVEVVEPVIVVMRWQGRLIGLLADGVCGMARVRNRELQALEVMTPSVTSSAGALRPVTHSFEHGDTVASLLDPGLIAALPGVPMVAEPISHNDDAHRGTREPVLLFRIGGLSLGIAAMSVDATVPRTELRANALKNPLCRGVIDHHGHEVPVVDTLALLGLGAAPADTVESAVLVLRFPTGCVGLMLDDVRDISPVARVDILPLPSLAMARADLFCGVLAGADSEQHLLLDAAALQTDELLQALASLSQAKVSAPSAGSSRAAGGARAAASARAGASYVTYQVGVETASPLAQVSEILRYPAHATPLQPDQNGVLGLFTHRGGAVPLVCLGQLLGRPAVLDPANARVLLVQDGGQTIGLVVQGLRSIEEARWEQPAEMNSTSASAMPTLSAVKRFQPLVEVGTADQRRTLPRLDLLLLVRALRNEAGRGRAAPVAEAASDAG